MKREPTRAEVLAATEPTRAEVLEVKRMALVKWLEGERLAVLLARLEEERLVLEERKVFA